MYLVQYSNILSWGTALSNPFYVTNGVWQGGLLSHQLFNAYINDLSVSLAKLNVGCNLHDISINHLVYADDTVLLAFFSQCTSKVDYPL